MCPHISYVFAKSCHVPVELEYKALWDLKALNLDYTKASKEKLTQLKELDEFCCKSYETQTFPKKKNKEIE